MHLGCANDVIKRMPEAESDLLGSGEKNKLRIHGGANVIIHYRSSNRKSHVYTQERWIEWSCHQEQSCKKVNRRQAGRGLARDSRSARARVPRSNVPCASNAQTPLWLRGVSQTRDWGADDACRQVAAC